jgi:hypothetical protein
MNKKGTKKIKCRICGKGFPVLATHIIRTHDLSTAEYLKRYSGAKLSSDEYRKTVSNTAKNRFINDPTMREKVATRIYDFVKNKKLVPLLRRDHKSAKVCLKNSLWKPSIILYGSIIEAILIEKNPSAKEFYDALKLAYNKKDISENEFYKIHFVRDLRNFVHLHKELSEGYEINENWAKTFAEICESIIQRFRKVH